MITWIIGNSGAGKTTLAKVIKYSVYDGIIDDDDYEGDDPYKNAVWLDGDNMRGVWTDLGLSKEDRNEQNMRVARLAKMLSNQGFNVVVSLICPYKELRKKVKAITNCKFIYIEGGKTGKDYPFDKPKLY